jgi:hypothetical protein
MSFVIAKDRTDAIRHIIRYSSIVVMLTPCPARTATVANTLQDQVLLDMHP